MTNNFERALGEGGFGVVYHGCVKGTQQVAAKVLSQSSSQGYKHFKAEVYILLLDDLTHVHVSYAYRSIGLWMVG